ncbi:MAG: aldehyde dehydrogenase family protein [Chlorobium sp.]|nr:aldehyde dehydrogenase family protein [Chlorobium sp.]
MLDELRQAFQDGRTESFAWRRAQLLALLRFLRERETDIAAAVYADLGKSGRETFLTETSFLAGEIRYALKHLKGWMQPSRRGVPLHYLFGHGAIRPEARGVVLIIGAWNYPIQLMLAPLVGALASGNCAVLKPSELAPHSSVLIAGCVGEYLDSRAIRVVEGGIAEAEALLAERFDFVFYTGNRNGGRQVLLAAASHIMPVALELGGKNPCIVEKDAVLKTAARRIVWAKFLNAGQTCIAPDYLLVHEDVEGTLLSLMQQAVLDFFGTDPRTSPDYSRIVNDYHFTRLERLLQDGTIVAGGQTHRASRYIAPTILRGVSAGSGIMESEIFGPLLPVLTYRELEEALTFIAERDDPLAIYLFSSSRATGKKVLRRTRSGSFCCNDLLFQSAIHTLPFGGTGKSGFGAYHGKAGFETFSLQRSVLFRSVYPDPVLRYPPYGRKKFGFLKRLVTLFG